eukprot:Opistho-2@5618
MMGFKMFAKIFVIAALCLAVTCGTPQVKSGDAEMDAIAALHDQLDTNDDGSVVPQESKEFLSRELHVKEHSVEMVRSEHNFHNFDTDKEDNNDFISVAELQRAWNSSKVRTWNVDTVADWLAYKLKMPQYVDTFRARGIDGKKLPLYALHKGALLKDIGVTNEEDRDTIIDKITLAVVFGEVDGDRNRLKDIVLAILVILVPATMFGLVRNTKGKKELDARMEQMRVSLEKAQKQADEYQKRLESSENEREKGTAAAVKAEKEKAHLQEHLQGEIEIAKAEAQRLAISRLASVEEENRLSLAEREVDQLREALKSAEERLTHYEKSSIGEGRLNPELCRWLQSTYHQEIKYYNERREVAEKRLRQANEEYLRVAKKKQSFLGSIRIAHGDGMDELQHRILTALSTVDKVKVEAEELILRWQRIEQLAGICVKDAI